jgi:hypothetical protein
MPVQMLQEGWVRQGSGTRSTWPLAGRCGNTVLRTLVVDVWMPTPLVSRVVIGKSIDALGAEVALAVDARRAANSRANKEAIVVFPEVRKRSIAAVILEVADELPPARFHPAPNFSG